MKVLFQCVIFGLGRYGREKRWSSPTLFLLQSFLPWISDSEDSWQLKSQSSWGWKCIWRLSISAHWGGSFSRLSLDQVAQEDVQLGFEYLHECRLHSFFRQLLCVQSSSQGKIFSYILIKFLVLQLLLHCHLSCHWAPLERAFFFTPSL